MQKHAYLIVANANFKVLEKCLMLIDDERNEIFLLFDSKSHISNDIKQSFCKIIHKAKIRAICEQCVNWAGYSQIDAVLNLMKMANSSDVKYDYIHFFQGSDLPIKSQHEIHRFFDDNQGKEFVSVEKQRSQMAKHKCLYRHFFCHNRYFRQNKVIKALNFGLVEIQKFLGIKKNTDIDLYQGSALFSITGDCAQFIESQAEEIFKRFRFSLAADECFMQTILMNSKYRDKIYAIENDTSSNARMIDRTRPDGKNSPHVWREAELEYLLTLSKEYCFARKFDENLDMKVVDMIFENITKGTYNDRSIN